jgi:hypothetical protein
LRASAHAVALDSTSHTSSRAASTLRVVTANVRLPASSSTCCPSDIATLAVCGATSTPKRTALRSCEPQRSRTRLTFTA